MNKLTFGLVSAVVLTTAAALVACLDTGPQTLTSEVSKIQIGHVPGLEDRAIVYRYYGWQPSYRAVEQYYAEGPPTTEEYSAEVLARGSAYPRLEVHYYVVAPGWDWNRDLVLDETYIKSYPVFRDQAITVSLKRVKTAGVAVEPFQVANSNCFAFLVRDIDLPRAQGYRPVPVTADGYYCAAPGVTINAALEATVLSNILVTDDLAHPRSPLLPVERAQLPEE